MYHLISQNSWISRKSMPYMPQVASQLDWVQSLASLNPPTTLMSDWVKDKPENFGKLPRTSPPDFRKFSGLL